MLILKYLAQLLKGSRQKENGKGIPFTCVFEENFGNGGEKQ
jgi:hypothetical protein